jgi:hypothetical protein
MSQIKLSGNASGAGVFTIASPATATDRTLNLPDSAGTLTTTEAVAASGYTTPAAVLTQFNASGSAPVYACRAWVNFNGAGTVSIRASGNVSSITDNGTGDYTVNFTTAMQDANYATDLNVGNNVNQIWCDQLTASSYRAGIYTGSAYVDDAYVQTAVFR